MDEAEIFVEDNIKTHKVIIFSKSTCPYCVQAKELFTSLGCNFISFELDAIPNGPAIQDYLGKKTGARTVPRVFINGKCIGGASDTQQLHAKGQLVALIE